MNKVKVQHYVPQFYLNFFCAEPEKLWVFDKQQFKSFQTNPKNVASEGYFYDDDNRIDGDAEQYLENLFGGFETNFAPILKSFIDGVIAGTIDKLDLSMKGIFCKYLTVQILRTNEAREQHFQFINTIKQSIIDKGWGDQIDFSKHGLDDSQIDRKGNHINQLIGNKALINDLHKILNDHIWMVFVNKTSLPLYTSDHPVVKHPHLSDPHRSMSGYGSKGIELSFPLSPNIVFSIAERTAFKAAERFENAVVDILDVQNIIYYNSLQVLDSYRQIYASADNFDLAKEMVTTHTYLRDPKHKRVDSE